MLLLIPGDRLTAPFNGPASKAVIHAVIIVVDFMRFVVRVVLCTGAGFEFGATHGSANPLLHYYHNPSVILRKIAFNFRIIKGYANPRDEGLVSRGRPLDRLQREDPRRPASGVRKAHLPPVPVHPGASPAPSARSQTDAVGGLKALHLVAIDCHLRAHAARPCLPVRREGLIMYIYKTFH
jgi:hypothetical protein